MGCHFQQVNLPFSALNSCVKLYHLWHNSWCWRIWEFLALECDLYLKPSEQQGTSHITYFQLGRDDGWISSSLGFRVCSLTSPHPVLLHPHYWASWKIMKYLPLYLANKANVVIYLLPLPSLAKRLEPPWLYSVCIFLKKNLYILTQEIY
jgi:hypothetical protein